MHALTVRRARKTGMNKKYNKKMGSIAVNNDMIGERVVVLLEREYRNLMWTIKNKESKIAKIRKIVE